MKKDLENIKKGLLNLKLNENLSYWYVDVTDHLSKSILKVIDSGEGFQLSGSSGSSYFTDSEEQEKLSFVEYVDSDNCFKIRVTMGDIRSTFKELPFNGFSLEEVATRDTEIPAYKIVAAK